MEHRLANSESLAPPPAVPCWSAEPCWGAERYGPVRPAPQNPPEKNNRPVESNPSVESNLRMGLAVLLIGLLHGVVTAQPSGSQEPEKLYTRDAIFQASLLEGRLAIEPQSLGFATGGLRRIRLRDFPESDKICVMFGENGNDQTFFFRIERRVDDLTTTWTNIQVSPDFTLIGHRIDTGGRVMYGMITQRAAQGVAFSLTDTLGATRETASVRAADLRELRLRKPDEYKTYILGAIRTAQLFELLTPNVDEAFQALSPAFPRDAQLRQRVRALVSQLDNDDFLKREQASRELETMGRAALVELSELPREGLSPEQWKRVQLLVKAHWRLTPEQARSLRDDPQFLLDCLYSADAWVQATALARLRDMAPAPAPVAGELPKELHARSLWVEQWRDRLP